MSLKHRFVALDYMNRRLHLFDEGNPAANWMVPSHGVLQDLQIAEDGRIVVSRDDGWAFHSPLDGHAEKIISVPGVKGLSALRLLPNGELFAGLNTKEGIELILLSADGKILKELKLHQYHDLRQLRESGEGTWLLAHHEGGIEFSPEGEILKSFTAPEVRYAYQLQKTANGNYLLSGGYAKALFEFSPSGRLLRSLSFTQPEGMESYFYSGFQILGNGNIVQANWNGHNDSDYKHGMKLFEFDQNGATVWSWQAPKEQVGSITAFQVF